MIAFKGSHFERDVTLWGVCWYVAYPISYQKIEEMMGERGMAVDHSTLHRWVSGNNHRRWGIEIMHMIRKGQLRSIGKLRPAQQFYSLAG